MKDTLKSGLRNVLVRRAHRRISQRINEYTKSFYPKFDFKKPVDGEKDYLEKWSGFLKFDLDPLYYRLYSTLSGVASVDYVPDDVYVIYILKLLNDQARDHAFADKNIYDLIFEPGIFPRAHLRKVRGAYLDGDYVPVSDVGAHIARMSYAAAQVIVKPTIDSASGKKVVCFSSDGEKLVDRKGNTLDAGFLESEYRDEFVIQERVQQELAVSRFNSESVNTVRIYTYRSVLTNEVHPLSFSLRVGAAGKVTDNLNSGGYGIGIHSNGRLFNRAIDKYGRSVHQMNNLDLHDEHVIPNFDEFIEIAKVVGSRFIYDRFLGLDVLRDQSGNMRLMEVNLGHIGTGLPHLIGTPLFGQYTDEVITYCRENKHKLENSYILNV